MTSVAFLIVLITLLSIVDVFLIVTFIISCRDQCTDGDEIGAVFLVLSIVSIVIALMITQPDVKELSYKEYSPQSIVLGIGEISVVKPNGKLLHQSFTDNLNCQSIPKDKIRVGVTLCKEFDGDTITYENIVIK